VDVIRPVPVILENAVGYLPAEYAEKPKRIVRIALVPDGSSKRTKSGFPELSSQR
jgi:hypothetical protein